MSANTPSLPFEFAVGIESTLIADERLDYVPPLRALEEFALMRHYEMWQQDLDLVAKLKSGERRVTKLRWCFPWYRIEATKGKFDFAWTDKVVDYADKLGIQLVPDLVHYGTPLWLENAFLDDDYPARVAEFGRLCAERYKGRIRHYTPANEPAMTGFFSSIRGEWPPYEKSMHAFINVMVNVCLGIQQSTKAIKSVDPTAECWAVEVVNKYKAANKQAEPRTKEWLRRDLVYWDMVHGKVSHEHEFYNWLTDNGAPADKLKQLQQNAVKLDVLGVNYYPWSVKTLEAKDGGVVETDSDDPDGIVLLDLLRECYAHTGAKMFVTETSAHGGGGKRSSSVLKKQPDMRIAWMDRTMEAVALARKEGLPVLGYTQFPLLTMVDWAYRTESEAVEDFFINLGMIEVDPKDYSRKWTPVADRFLQHLETFETSGALVR